MNRYQFGMADIGDIAIGIGSVWGIWGISVSVRYTRYVYGRYRYRFCIEDMDMRDIGILVSYRLLNVISVSKSVLTRYRYQGKKLTFQSSCAVDTQYS